jgi:hypothetical protein
LRSLRRCVNLFSLILSILLILPKISFESESVRLAIHEKPSTFASVQQFPFIGDTRL